MRKLTLFAVLAASVLGVPVAGAQERGRDWQAHRERLDAARAREAARRHDRFDHRRDRGDRTWRRGERFEPRFARNYAVIDHRRYRGLRAPPRGYRYVRSGNDAVLISVATGIVAAIVANAIR